MNENVPLHDGMTSGASVWRRMGSVVLALPLLYLLVIVGSWFATTRTADDGATCVIPGVVRPPECLIAQVAPDSPADRAGLHPGDAIVATSGDLFIPPDGVLRWYYHQAPGEPVTLMVRRATQGSAGSSGGVVAVPLVLGSRIQAPGLPLNFLPWTLGGLVALAVAVVVIRARPDDPAARLLFFVTVVFTSSVAIGAWAYAGRRDPPLDTWYWWAFWVPTLLTSVLQLHLFLTFPTPRAFLIRLRALGPTWLRRGGGGTFLLYLPVLTSFESTRAHAPLLQNLVQLVLLLALIVTLISGYRMARTPLTRAQLKWPICAFAVVIATGILGPLSQTATGHVILPSSTPLLVFGLVPLAIGIAILRYRLFDIDIVIRRTLLYGALTGSLAAIYIGSVVLLQAVFRLLVGQATDVAIVASTLAIAALFQPLRHRIQRIIDRRFYRQKYDAARTLASFSAALRDEVDLAQLSERLTVVVEETMQPTRVALWLRPSTRERKRNVTT